MKDGNSNEPLIGLADAAKLLNVSPDTVRRAVDNGKLKGYTTPGGHRRIYRWSVEAMLAERAA